MKACIVNAATVLHWHPSQTEEEGTAEEMMLRGKQRDRERMAEAERWEVRESLSSSIHQGSHYSWTLPEDSLKRTKIKRIGHLSVPISFSSCSPSHSPILLTPLPLPFLRPPDCFWLKLQKKEKTALHQRSYIYPAHSSTTRERGKMCAQTHTHTKTQSKESETLPHAGHYSFSENIHQSVNFCSQTYEVDNCQDDTHTTVHVHTCTWRPWRVTAMTLENSEHLCSH